MFSDAGDEKVGKDQAHNSAQTAMISAYSFCSHSSPGVIFFIRCRRLLSKVTHHVTERTAGLPSKFSTFHIRLRALFGRTRTPLCHDVINFNHLTLFARRQISLRTGKSPLLLSHSPSTSLSHSLFKWTASQLNTVHCVLTHADVADPNQQDAELQIASSLPPSDSIITTDPSAPRALCNGTAILIQTQSHNSRISSCLPARLTAPSGLHSRFST